MSKAILVIDMPDKCTKCNFCWGWLHCILEDKTALAFGKPDWCPLKPMPKKKDSNKALTWEHKKVIDGFNLCIDRILDN